MGGRSERYHWRNREYLVPGPQRCFRCVKITGTSRVSGLVLGKTVVGRAEATVRNWKFKEGQELRSLTTGHVKKLFQRAPVEYFKRLAKTYCPDLDTPTVQRESSYLSNHEEILSPSLSPESSTTGMRGIPGSQSSPTTVSGEWTPKTMLRGPLWFFLHDWGSGDVSPPWRWKPAYENWGRRQLLLSMLMGLMQECC